MAEPTNQERIEAQFGKPLREVLVEQLNAHQSYEAVAHALGTSYSWIADKVKELRIEKRHSYVAVEQVPS